MTTAVSAEPDGTLSSVGFGCDSSMMVKTLRSFDSALRVFVPGGEDGGLGRRGGEGDRAMVELLKSELDADGIASAHSEPASE